MKRAAWSHAASVAIAFAMTGAATEGSALAQRGARHGAHHGKKTVAAAKRCVAFSQRDTDDGLEFHLENQCEAEVACKVAWKVVCDGKEEPHDQSLTLAVGDVETIAASAGACTGDWTITAPTWSCRGSTTEK